MKYFTILKAPFPFSVHIPREQNTFHCIIDVICGQYIPTYHLIKLNQNKFLNLFYTKNETGNKVVVCT